MKIESVMKNNGYITVTFTERINIYGVLITEATNNVEFMKWGLSDREPIVINEETDPEQLEELKGKYLPTILEHIEKQ